jgi:hypothetical protein
MRKRAESESAAIRTTLGERNGLPPEAGVPAAPKRSLNHLVGTEQQRLRDREAKWLCGFEVED